EQLSRLPSADDDTAESRWRSFNGQAFFHPDVPSYKGNSIETGKTGHWSERFFGMDAKWPFLPTNFVADASRRALSSALRARRRPAAGVDGGVPRAPARLRREGAGMAEKLPSWFTATSVKPGPFSQIKIDDEWVASTVDAWGRDAYRQRRWAAF